MDKETLSHYGWIVILVLILAVMLALASPFGSFIAGAIKSTTAGLFNVNQAALGSAGIDVNDMVFENCDHLETEIRNATDTYTGDTCCKTCGAVLQAGQTIRAKVPEGGKYTAADGTVYNPGDEMPEVVTTGDIYTYHNYEYRYNFKGYHPLNSDVYQWLSNESQAGWGVRALNGLGGPILESINGEPITSMALTFYRKNMASLSTVTVPETVTDMTGAFERCEGLSDISTLIIPNGVTSLASAFKDNPKLADASVINIPNSVTDMESTFSGCVMLTKTPTIPYGVTNMKSTFSGCTSLVTPPVLPDSVTNMYRTFYNCSSLTSAPKIPSATTDMTHTFWGCTLLTDVSSMVFPSGVTNLVGTFAKSGLTDDGLPTIPNTVTSLYSTFQNCTSLVDASNLIIPSSVTGMYGTFAQCTSLEVSPVIPSTVTNISALFSNCTNLKDVSETIVLHTQIMQAVFYNCTSLTGVVHVTTPPNYGPSLSNCFAGTTQPIKLIGTGTNTVGLQLLAETSANGNVTY